MDWHGRVNGIVVQAVQADHPVVHEFVRFVRLVLRSRGLI
jgi:hypothetical protein